MAVAFRNKTWVTNTALNVTPTEPTGAAQGDIIFVWIVTDKTAGGATTISAPDGTWTAVSATLAGTHSIGRLFWIRRGSSSPTYSNFNWNGSTGSYYECHASAWSGCKSSGNPWDQLGTILNQLVTSSANTVQLNNAITPTVAPSLCVLFSQWWSGASAAYTAPSGYTRFEGENAGEDECGAYKSLASTSTETPGPFGGVNSDTNDGMGYTLNLIADTGGSTAWTPQNLDHPGAMPGKNTFPSLRQGFPTPQATAPGKPFPTAPTNFRPGPGPGAFDFPQFKQGYRTANIPAPAIPGVLPATSFHPGKGPGAFDFPNFRQGIAAPVNADVTKPLTGPTFVFTQGALTPSVAASRALTGTTFAFSPGLATAKVSYVLVGQTLTLGQGTPARVLGYILAGKTFAFTAGALASALSKALVGQTPTFSLGTITANVQSGVTKALVGQTFSFTQGTPKATFAKALVGQTAAFTQGSFVRVDGYVLVGRTITFSQGTPTRALASAFTGQTPTFTLGTITPSVAGDVTKALTGTALILSQGNITVPGGVAPVYSVGGGGGGGGRELNDLFRKRDETLEFEGRRTREILDDMAFAPAAAPNTVRAPEDDDDLLLFF
jgi:hypothetical protein